MGLAGAGAGAAQGLGLLQRLLLAQKAQQDQTDQAKAMLSQRQSEAEDATRHRTFLEGVTRRNMAREEAGDAAAADAAAYSQTADANMSELLNDPAQFEAFGVASGKLKPIDVMNLRKAQAPKKREVRTYGADGKTEVSRMVGEDEEVPVYREPKTGPAPNSDQVWVMRDGQPTPIAKGTARPGDRPYEKGSGGPVQADASAAYGDERTTRTREAVDALIAKVGPMTTGMGSLLANIPATDARNFSAELDTLKSNIAFNELAQMRAASKTGGALGAVSEKEMRLLESSLGALDAGQSPAQFRQQLTRIRESLDRFEQAKGGPRPMTTHETGQPSKPKFTILGVK